MDSDAQDKHEPKAQRESAFPSTRWSLIVRAKGDETTVAEKAVSDICEFYYYPLYVFALRTGSRPQDAMDLTQGFFEFFLRTQAYTKADPDRGRLRSFLLASFKNFASTERRKQQAAKRGGKEEILPLDPGEGSPVEYADPNAESPDLAFDRAWAKTIIDLVGKKLHDEFRASGKERIFRELRGFLTGQEETRSYADAAATLGIKEGAARVTVHRMRNRFKELFRAEVAQTLEDDSQVAEEVAHLKQALSA